MRTVAFAMRAVGAALMLAGASVFGLAWLLAPEAPPRQTYGA